MNGKVTHHPVVQRACMSACFELEVIPQRWLRFTQDTCCSRLYAPWINTTDIPHFGQRVHTVP